MRIWAIMPAAGIGRRFRSTTPKQYLSLCGAPIILHSINRLLGVQNIEKLIVALHPEDKYWAKLNVDMPKVKTINGGEERYYSVLNAIEHLMEFAEKDDWVLVHDAVRPCLSELDLQKLIFELENEKVGGLLASPIVNTLKRVDENMEISKTIDRKQLWSALTPQMFRYGLLKKAFDEQKETGIFATDEAGAIEALGFSPKIVEGEKTNIKITQNTDLDLAGFIISSRVRS